MICIGIASSVASHGLQSFLPGKVLYEGDPVIPGTYDNVTALQCQEPWLSHVGELGKG
jgi:hypothetical protein